MKKLKSMCQRSNRGFNLIEVLFAVFILVFMTLMFAAVVPITLRSVKTANSYNLAVMVAQRKLDQLMDPSIGYANLSLAGLQGDSTYPSGRVISKTGTSTDACEWFDPAATTSGTFGQTNYVLTGYFTKLDGLRKVKQNGTAACSARSGENAFPGDSDVVGQMVIEGWEGKMAGGTDSPVMKATVTITWRNRGQGISSYTASTLIPK